MPELTSAFEQQTGTQVTVSLGATSRLAQQIENGAPFDVFLAADTTTVDRLIEGGYISPKSRMVYARGVLVLWGRRPVRSLEELAGDSIRFVGVAQPEVAPYGRAAIEALKATGLWAQVEPKVVYAPNVLAAWQYADSGNADVAFTAQSLVLDEEALEVDAGLYTAIEQGAGTVTGRDPHGSDFLAFLGSGEGKAIIRRWGYKVD